MTSDALNISVEISQSMEIMSAVEKLVNIVYDIFLIEGTYCGHEMSNGKCIILFSFKERTVVTTGALKRRTFYTMGLRRHHHTV